ncbi:MAG: MFS transporter [Pseudomonadota bacterium]
MARNIALYPWFKVFQNLVFWQGVWFLYIQGKLGPAEAILMYVIYDLATTGLEVPSGYMSDRLGRRLTLLLSALALTAGALIQAWGQTFAVFAAGQILVGASMAFASGTDSALLYESLAGENREDEIETQEILAWRYSFVALAASAVAGGLLFYVEPSLTYIATALSGIALLGIVGAFQEPETASKNSASKGEVLATLQDCFRQPVLLWILGLTVAMYTYSHIPFVFGQPFIQEALADLGFSAEAPVVSGVVSAIMMGVSVLASLFAPALRQRIGLAAMLLLAFGLQLALVAALSLSNAAPIIALLFLRMVPSALSTPFLLARVQPILADASRATYLSLQSFAGRIVFAATLSLSAASASTTGQMPYPEIQAILTWYALAGLLVLSALAFTAHRAGVNRPLPETST